MKRFLSAPSLLALLAACSSTPTVIPTRNLQSPSDMTFVCLRTDGDVLSGQPMSSCHRRDALDPASTVNGQRVLGTFAFISNPGRDEIAVADMDRGRLLDLAEQSPGYGMLPSGKNPLVITSSRDGCWVATANRGSCNFTMVDPARLLKSTFSAAGANVKPSTEAGDVSRAIRVVTASGVLAASVAELAFLPAPNAAATCDPAATPRAIATFPGCNMVALLDFSFAAGSAKIVDAYYVRPDLPSGYLAAGADPVCPAECDVSGASSADGGFVSVDAGVPLDGSAGAGGIDAGVRGTPYLQAMALVPDGSRVYVGGLNGDSITSLEISGGGFANPRRVTLAENAGGIRRLRLGVDPYAIVGDVEGAFVDTRGRFLYAFAGDDSVRVVNIDADPVECDVNLVFDSSDVANIIKPCHPVGEPGFRRRPLVQGPGLRLPPLPSTSSPDSPPPVARDISFVDLVSTSTANPHALNGQFGVIIASNGKVYFVNLAPTGEDKPTPQSDDTIRPAAATHSFRERRDTGRSSSLPLSMFLTPQRTNAGADQAFPTIASYSAADGPQIQSFTLDGTSNYWLDLPDPSYVVSRVWGVTWEGALPGATRSSGLVSSQGGLAGVLSDRGADFCASGVQPGDVIMFSGCTQDSDCQPDDQFICQPTVSGGQSMCLPRDTTARTKLIEKPTCTRFLGSRMRYEIADATSTKMNLRLKLDEVPKTSLNPCQTNNDCRPDVDHGKLAGETPDSGKTRAFECLEIHPADHRCVERCVEDTDCRAGHVCEDVAGTLSTDKLCVEAPPLDPACFQAPMTASYSVRAGHAFVVAGNAMPSISPFKRTATGTCGENPLGDASLVTRIPLSAPKCPDEFLAPAANPAPDPKQPWPWVQNLAAQPGANPCLYTGDYRDGSSAAASSTGTPRIRAFFQNPQIRFVLSNLEKYAGDLLAIRFELQNGFEPLTPNVLTYDVLLTMQSRIITGPTHTPESPLQQRTGSSTFPYLYVVDQGRTALTSGSQGQVVRLNLRSSSSAVVAFDSTLSGSSPFQIQ